MTRRDVLVRAAAVLAGTLSLGHTPYRQWQVYRQSRLILVISAEDEPAFALAEAMAALLATYLPESAATVARARDVVDVASLLASRQLDTALLTAAEVGAAAAGRGRFAGVGPLPLRALAVIGPYVLVCREDFPAGRAYRVAQTVTERGGELPRPAGGSTEATAPVPLHPGALDYHHGRPPRP
jgi:TRAP-type uncharacterized transport system substrate-binding protein